MTRRRIASRAVALSAVGFVVVVLLAGFLLPTDYRMEHEARLSSPPDAIWPLVSDLSEWNRWSHWHRAMSAKYDVRLEGADAPCQGAMIFSEEGEEKGRVAMIDCDPPNVVRFRLPATSGEGKGAIRLLPDGDGTRVIYESEVHTENPIARWALFLVPFDARVRMELIPAFERLDEAAR